MIDPLSETLISLAQAADDLPRRRRGRKPHVSCLYRWTTAGCRGVVLESLQVGGTRCTSREALARFIERLSRAGPAGDEPVTPPGHRSPARRLRDSERAGEKLEALGA